MITEKYTGNVWEILETDDNTSKQIRKITHKIDITSKNVLSTIYDENNKVTSKVEYFLDNSNNVDSSKTIKHI